MALYFNNLEVESSERKKTLQIIEAMNRGIRQEIFSNLSYISVNHFDTTKHNKELTNYIRKHPLKRNTIFMTYLNSEQVIRNINPIIFSYVNMESESVDERVMNINSYPDSNFTTRKTRIRIAQYLMNLDYISNALTFQEDCLKKNRSDKFINEELGDGEVVLKFSKSRFHKITY